MTDMSKQIGTEWKALDDAKKKPYRDRAAAAKQEYQVELQEYEKTSEFSQFQRRLEQWKLSVADGVGASPQQTPWTLATASELNSAKKTDESPKATPTKTGSVKSPKDKKPKDRNGTILSTLTDADATLNVEHMISSQAPACCIVIVWCIYSGYFKIGVSGKEIIGNYQDHFGKMEGASIGRP